MNTQLTEIMRLITNLIRTGIVTEVDRKKWLCRVKVGELETNWINWLTLRAGGARTWWCPSPDEQVVVLSMGGNLETAFVLPAIYSNQFPPPSDSVDGCVTEYPDGGWFEYEPATGRWHVRGIKSMVIEAADSVTYKTSEFVVEADTTRINSEVVINGGVMVAYSMGNDLEQLAGNCNVKRLTIVPADNDAVPPVAAVMESDEALRQRIPAAFEGLSVAGPTGAYEFHARSADGRVADASATSPAPAEVVLTVLSREGDGTAGADLLAVVEQALNSEKVRPVADRLTVRSAEIIPYSVDATIFLYPGPEAEPVMAEAKASLQKYIASQTRLGRDIRRSAIYAALHVEGVQRVELTSPQGDVVLDKTQAASCTEWSIINGGTDE